MTETRTDDIVGWFAGRLPDDWYTEPPEVRSDRDEILVVGRLAEPDLGADPDPATAGAARRSRIERHREETRVRRIEIARDAQWRYRRRVSWGARCGDERQLFTTFSAPTGTRLGMEDRELLDTLVRAGVAADRHRALAWCVRLVRQHETDWVQQLRDALAGVDAARASGPDAEGEQA